MSNPLYNVERGGPADAGEQAEEGLESSSLTPHAANPASRAGTSNAQRLEAGIAASFATPLLEIAEGGAMAAGHAFAAPSSSMPARAAAGNGAVAVLQGSGHAGRSEGGSLLPWRSMQAVQAGAAAAAAATVAGCGADEAQATGPSMTHSGSGRHSDPHAELLAMQAVRRDICDRQLEVQASLGWGSCGVVYRGTWKGLPVAVKVVLLQGDCHARRPHLMEAAISSRSVMSCAVRHAVGGFAILHNLQLGLA